MRKKKKIIDYDLVYKLAYAQCSIDEIDELANCGKKALKEDTKLKELIRKGRNEGKAKLRITQLELAKSNVQMAIWLGKQYLNQVDYKSGEGGAFGDVKINVNFSKDKTVNVEEEEERLTKEVMKELKNG